MSTKNSNLSSNEIRAINALIRMSTGRAVMTSPAAVRAATNRFRAEERLSFLRTRGHDVDAIRRGITASGNFTLDGIARFVRSDRYKFPYKMMSWAQLNAAAAKKKKRK